MKAQEHKTRETWLVAALWQFIDQHFMAAGLDVPPNIRLTCGWPSSQALARKHMAIGECWDISSSGDKTFEICVSPAIDEPTRVLDILMHEVLHATVGLKEGHGKKFSQGAKAIGLLKPWTKTTASPDLLIDLNLWVQKLGPYPHASLGVKYGVHPDGTEDRTIILVPPRTSPHQKTRMLRLQCECGCIIRTTRKWLDLYEPHLWECPCGNPFDVGGES